ncbi:hypothetical protein SAMD00019534_011570 [Acytostelium subglobosum LB1]|uniref:hypothetical protein n=1 Tax=Acytostelium subglobosum LB1 TaxID=1410327 RepID=UPI000644F3B2|nr:hypothetical protein SAMD00019534_011570 [Acytostelium subglobosum LB1]GAM17982.1 hypothetical protein SAMD00019534_011570 [Acytostelium subglobosum LB1]|eukprot:XP_012758578.1 hypothetical protein SAMD00019534_011570 [Acytostelium subglobosum LB1]
MNRSIVLMTIVVALCFCIYQTDATSIQGPAGIKVTGASGNGKPGAVLDKYSRDPGFNSAKPKLRYDWSLCRLHVHDSGMNYRGFADFHPRVDEFTTLRIPLSNNSILFNPNVTIWLEFQANVSTVNQVYTEVENTYYCPNASTPANATAPPPPPAGVVCNETVTFYKVNETIVTNFTTYGNITLPPKRVYYYDLTRQQGYTLFSMTVVLTIDKGVLVNAQWDGDRDHSICKQCNYCLMNQCAARANTLKCDQEAGCALKIFVAWQGKDKNDKPCISITKAPSNFSMYSFNPISQLGLGLISDILGKIVGNTNNPNTA